MFDIAVHGKKRLYFMVTKVSANFPTLFKLLQILDFNASSTQALD